jgi:hypothetical protein
VKILHIFKSGPDGETRQLANALSEGRESTEMARHSGDVDYDDLVKKVFENDQTVCWW